MANALVHVALLLVTTSAYAADPNVCRPYARDFTQQIIRYTWNRAYVHCLAMESTPVLPRDWDSEMKILLPDTTPPIDTSQIGVVPATGKPVDAPKPPVAPVAAKPTHDAARAASCARHHPQSWRASDGTWNKFVGGKWMRVPCAK
jgi:hypothetical protein